MVFEICSSLKQFRFSQSPLLDLSIFASRAEVGKLQTVLAVIIVGERSFLVGTLIQREKPATCLPLALNE